MVSMPAEKLDACTGFQSPTPHVSIWYGSASCSPGETLLFIATILVYLRDMPKPTPKKRKPGRPPSEEAMQAIQLKLPPALLAALDQHVDEAFGDSRAAVIRRFIVQGLKREGKK
jgi:hypothetical protein